MRLGDLQEIHTLSIGRLISWVFEQEGLTGRIKDSFRDPRVHGEFGEKKSYSAASSLHKLGCATDLALFRDGEYLIRSECYAPLGEYWKALNPLNKWGGEPGRNDGNHFSTTDTSLW